jgi:PAS domain S-box-containing protein
VLGYSSEALIGRDASELAHPDDRVLLIAARERMRAGEDEQTVTFRARHANGRFLWAEAKLRAVRDPESGEPLEIVSVLRDISERKGIEAQLIEAVDEAKRAALVKSQFLATMSHEIRTPLNGVIGFADLLERTELTPAQRQYVELQRDAGKALLTIINDILDFSKLDAGKVSILPTSVDLHGLIESCIKWFRESAEKKGLGITINIAPTLPRWVSADGPRLQQILCNLLSNAIKFTRSGEISIKAIPASNETSLVAIAVSDTGIGIADDKLDLLFQRFSQIDGSIAREFGGTGLGLAISKRLIELMGGRIAVQSVVDHGSTFTVTLPLEPAAAPAYSVASGADPGSPRSGVVRVLVAEDNVVNQKLIRAILIDAGYSVDIVGNGREAIASLLAIPYDLVLMDVQMPIMDGWQAAREIRTLPGAAGQIPIVALTAHVLAEDVARCAEAGMQDHIAKPIRRDELIKAIERATHRRSHVAA